MSDYGSAYISKAFAKACSVLKLKHIRTRPYTPRTNVKAERFIQTLCKEWAYAIPFQNSIERNLWLPPYLSIYKRLRQYVALSSGSMSGSAEQFAEAEHLVLGLGHQVVDEEEAVLPCLPV